MPLSKVFNHYKSQQTAFHNLCTENQPPQGTDEVLWLGLNFAIEKALPKPKLEASMERLIYDIRIKSMMATPTENQEAPIINAITGKIIPQDGDTDEYDPKLYLRSTNYVPPTAPAPIEAVIQDFQAQLQQEIDHHPQKLTRKHNINPSTRRVLQALPHNPDFIVVPTNKNLGPAILDRPTYIKRCLQDHLMDKSTYQQLTEQAAQSMLDTAVQGM